MNLIRLNKQLFASSLTQVTYRTQSYLVITRVTHHPLSYLVITRSLLSCSSSKVSSFLATKVSLHHVIKTRLFSTLSIQQEDGIGALLSAPLSLLKGFIIVASTSSKGFRFLCLLLK